jgi:voltage-gated potassium channel
MPGATVLSNDAANVFITLSAPSLNSRLEIIARGEVPSTESKLLQAGRTRWCCRRISGRSALPR